MRAHRLMPTHRFFSHTRVFARRFHKILPAKGASTILQYDDFAASVQPLIQSKEKMAIFLDLDDTLVTTRGYNPDKHGDNSDTPAIRQSGYGSDIWFTNTINALNQLAPDKTSPDYAKLFLMALNEYFIIQHHAHLITTEPCVPEMLKQLRMNKNKITVGLTARSGQISDITLQRLREHGIAFTYSHQDNARIALDVPAKEEGQKPFYYRGVIFCCGVSKEICLAAFFKTDIGAAILAAVDLVAFLEDKYKYCQTVFDYLKAIRKPAYVVHYTHVEKKLPVASDEEIQEDRARLSQFLQITLRF